MKQVIETGLPNSTGPYEWAVMANGTLYTALIAIKADGSLETGDIKAQTRLTLENLKRVVEAAGGTLDDVTQVVVYITGADLFAGMNEVYAGFFSKPFPNRATVVAAALPIPGTIIEISAQAHIGKAGKSR